MAGDSLMTDTLNMLMQMKALNDKYLDEEENEHAGQQLEDAVKTMCQLDLDMKSHNKAIADTKDQLKNNNENNPDIIEDLYRQNLDKYQSSSSNQDLCSHPFYKSVLVDGQNVTECEEVKEKPAEALTDGDYDEINDSIMCSNTFSIPIDPISKTEVTEPYKNRKCGHVYQNGYIQMYIQRRKRKARCPYIGCNNQTLEMNDLIHDEALQTQIENFKKTQNN